MSTQARTQLVTIPRQELDKYTQLLWGAAETVYAAQEVVKFHRNGGKADRIIIVTSGAFYVIRKKNLNLNRPDLRDIYSIVSLRKISYIEPDNLTVFFGENEFNFRSPDALSIGQILVNQFAVIMYQVPGIEIPIIESTPQSALKPPHEINFRPASLFQVRMIVLAHHYNTKFPLQNVRAFREWDHKHSGPFKIDGSFEHNGAIQALAHTISWDTDLKSLIIDNFAPDQLGLFVSTIFKYSFALTSLSIENMKSAINTDFEFGGREDSAIRNITFKATHPNIISAFFNALEKFNGRIKSLVISECNIHSEELIDLFQAITTFPCFMKLQYLYLNKLSINDFPLEEFSAMISKLRVLSSIRINEIDIEGSDLLGSILKNAQLPRHVEVTGIKFAVPTPLELPESVTHLNISNNEFTVESFSKLIKSILSKQKSAPLFLTASNIKGASTKQFLRHISDSNILPLIYELDWSGNRLSPKDMKAFLNFLKTQTNIKFLTIERCISHEDQPDRTFQFLSEFLKTHPIEGLSLLFDSSSPVQVELLTFIQSITGLAGIKSLRMVNSQLRDSGIEQILKFAQESPDINELDIDGLDASNPIDLIRLYNGLLMNPKIVSLTIPVKDINSLGINKDNMQPEIKKMLLALKTKKVPKNAAQRLALIEHLQIEINEDNQSDEINFESMLSIIEPASLASKHPSAVNKDKLNPLEELTSVMKAMVSVMKDQPPERQVEPLPMARMIMDHIVTFKKAFKFSSGSKQNI